MTSGSYIEAYRCFGFGERKNGYKPKVKINSTESFIENEESLDPLEPMFFSSLISKSFTFGTILIFAVGMNQHRY